MGKESPIGLGVLAVFLLLFAVLIAGSEAEPFVKAAFVIGLVAGAIVSLVALVKSL